ncbi:MAG: chorismate-binding protein, partial [Pseudomonadota bacterium]
MDDDGYRAAAPLFREFEKGYTDGKAQIVYRRVPGDLDTPVSAYLKLTGGSKDSFLLESVEGGETLGRYSTIGLKPDLVWRAFGDKPEINRDPRISPDKFTADDKSTIASLHHTIEASQIDLDPEIAHRLPPMSAGIFGYFGYDFVRLTEHLPNRPPDPFGVPDGYFIRPTLLAIFDNVKHEVVLITPVRPQSGVSAHAAYSRASERLADAISDLGRPIALSPKEVSAPEFTSNMTDAAFNGMVAKAKDYIAAGDIFQVVLSQRFETPFELPPFELYRALRRTNPSPFQFFLEFGTLSLVGSSPE